MADSPSFDEFYQANYSRTVALVAGLTGNRAEAEDLAQEAFARALVRWTRLGTFDLPEAWVRKVALRLATDAGRRVRRSVRVMARLSAQRPAQDPMPGDTAGFGELELALARLPMPQRQVIVLYYLADLPVDQIAREFGMPLGTVKARLVAGRKRLERELSAGAEAVHDAR